MDSFGHLMPVLSQLISQLAPRDKSHQSKAEMEVLVRSVVNDCLQQQAATERREMMNGMMEILKERVGQPAEARRESDLDDLLKKFRELNSGKGTKQSGRDKMQIDKDMVQEVVKEMLNEQKSGKTDSRDRSRDGTGSKNFVLPWCDNQDSNSKSKAAGKGKQFSERKGSVNDTDGKNFNDKGSFEKKSFDNQAKKFNREQGDFNQGGFKKNFPQERSFKDNNRVGGFVRPRNNAHQAGPNRYGADPRAGSQNQYWQQEGAMGYGPPNSASHQRPMNNQMHQLPFGPAHNVQHGPVSPNYQPGPPNYQPGPPNYHPGPPGPANYQPGLLNYQPGLLNYQPGPSNYHPGPPGPANYQPGPPSFQPGFVNQKMDNSYQSGKNVNFQAAKSGYNPAFRGRGGFQRGGYNRGGYTNRPEQRGNNLNTNPSLSDVVAALSPEEVTSIKNVLKSESSGTKSKKSNKNQATFKQQKSNFPGKPSVDESDDDQGEDEVKHLSTNENKVLDYTAPTEVQSTGAKKKKNKNKATDNNVKPDDDQKPKEADEPSGPAASENLKLLVGLGINKDVLNNVDAKQEIKHVILIARCGDETKTFQPKNIGELKEFMGKHPKAEAIIVKKD